MTRDFFFVDGITGTNVVAHIGEVLTVEGELLVQFVLCGRLKNVRWTNVRRLTLKRDLKKKVCRFCWRKLAAGDVDRCPVDRINWSPHPVKNR